MKIDPTKIKAVIFDWGGVCCSEGEPFASFDLQQTLAMGPGEIAAKAQEIYAGYYAGHYNKDLFWNKIMGHFGLSVSEKINPDALSSAYLHSYSIYPEVLDLANKLKSKYKVGLLSNLTPEMRDHIVSKHALDKVFTELVFSCDPDIAALKPNPKPYSVLCQKMGAQPTECVFIDNAPKNIAAAEILGMQTILFKDVEQFLKDSKPLYE